MFNKVHSIHALSIKKLTLLGFSLVALPLVIALIYGANQVSKLSSQGADAIFDVAQLTQVNRELSQTLLKMERFASQYLVLQDNDLRTNYILQKEKLTGDIQRHLSAHTDPKLKGLALQFSHKIQDVHQLVIATNAPTNRLEKLQRQFFKLAQLGQKLNLHSNELINLHTSQLTKSADDLSNIMLYSLLSIPLSLLVAGVFVTLITAPLKQLIANIQHLEQGGFEHKIILKTSPEISEIADALEIMRTRLHALELQKSSFIRHISHELKTPLAAIREGTELLYDNSVGELNVGQQEICHIIRSSVNRLQCHIEDLLNFNIVLDSTSLQDSEKINLTPLIKNVLAERILDIKRKNITLELAIDELFIHTNAKQLKVILDNLLSNAIKYSPNTGTIQIKADIEQETLRFKIIDQGPGIAKAIQEKVFDAFYQGPVPAKQTIKGSGLGLTIVKELIMRLNGTINIDSNPDKHPGTSVTISLPKAEKYPGTIK
mgnify:CR=1 FL=1